ncbi:MAG TPA: cupredoxin domain-containing protein [Thermodesulfovibrionales bacterium]|nr:cupredoxin domain-containing protein [Thermodesulfovibrionales bacterium]
MDRKSMGLTLAFAIVLLAFAACASQQPLVTLGPARGEVVLAMKASSFSFEPNNIKAYRGDVVVLKIENTSGAGHNFTIKDPQGNVVQNVDLPSKKTATATVPLSETGTYEFYCDKPFHSTYGMKGQIVVIQGP